MAALSVLDRETSPKKISEKQQDSSEHVGLMEAPRNFLVDLSDEKLNSVLSSLEKGSHDHTTAASTPLKDISQEGLDSVFATLDKDGMQDSEVLCEPIAPFEAEEYESTPSENSKFRILSTTAEQSAMPVIMSAEESPVVKSRKRKRSDQGETFDDSVVSLRNKKIKKTKGRVKVSSRLQDEIAQLLRCAETNRTVKDLKTKKNLWSVASVKRRMIKERGITCTKEEVKTALGLLTSQGN